MSFGQKTVTQREFDYGKKAGLVFHHCSQHSPFCCAMIPSKAKKFQRPVLQNSLCGLMS